MDDGLFDKFSTSVWPVITSNPGVSLSLIGIGLAVGWIARAWLGRERMGTMSEKVEVADRQRAVVEFQLTDISGKHKSLSDRLTVTVEDNEKLKALIRSGAPVGALTAASGVVSAHLKDTIGVSSALGTTLSTLSLGFGGSSYPADVSPLRDTSSPLTARPEDRFDSHPSYLRQQNSKSGGGGEK